MGMKLVLFGILLALCGIAAASMNFFAWCLAGLGALCGLMGPRRKD